MDWGFSWLLDFINGFWNIITEVIVWLVDGLVWCIQSCVYLILEGFYGAILGVVELIDVSALAASAAVGWGLIPSQLGYLLVAVGLPQAVGIIISAIGIRMVLNLIPAAFTRI